MSLLSTFKGFYQKHAKRILVILGILAAACGSYFRIFELFELGTYDWRCQLRVPRPVSDKIVLIEVDNATVQAFGSWPFDRANYGKLISVLRQAPVLAIVFDAAISTPQAGDPVWVEQAALAGNAYFGMILIDPQSRAGRFVSDGIEVDLPAIYRSAAKGVGLVNAGVDIDGKRRRICPIVYCRGASYLHLAFLVAADLLGIPHDQIYPVADKHLQKVDNYLQFSKDVKIPLDEDGSFLVSYAAGWRDPGDFKHYSFLDIYNNGMPGRPRFDLSQLKGKICVMGVTATAAHDMSPIPLGPKYRMVGLYANIINSILNKDFIRRLDRFTNLVILALCAFAMGIISVRLKPVRGAAIVIGVILAYSAAVSAVFVRWGLWVDLFYPVAMMIGLYAIVTLARVIIETRKRQLAETELKVAGQIQQSFLPESPPEVKGLNISCFMQAAKGVGGDMYAFVPLEGGRLGVMVGDVAGKGTPAALFMAKVVSEFKFAAYDRLNPAEVLRRLNDRLVMDSRSGLLVTLSYVIFDPNNRKLIMASGGHLPMVALSKEGEIGLLNAGEGIPLGVIAGTPFTTYERELEDGECFVFYSDGVSEARNLKGEEFGIKALEEVVAANQKSQTRDILDSAVRAVGRFIGKAEQHDDITMIIVKTSF
ncbi:MAG: SpoIIE family protein phosphatase [Candidatus Omnitrophota bacterium]